MERDIWGLICGRKGYINQQNKLMDGWPISRLLSRDHINSRYATEFESLHWMITLPLVSSAGLYAADT